MEASQYNIATAVSHGPTSEGEPPVSAVGAAGSADNEVLTTLFDLGRQVTSVLDYKDAPNPYDCPAPCDAPELDGTAMMDHAGTKWLTTTAGVTPGEEIELVFAVFDLSDPILDTVVLLDNFQWACEGGPQSTIPQ